MVFDKTTEVQNISNGYKNSKINRVVTRRDKIQNEHIRTRLNRIVDKIQDR